MINDFNYESVAFTHSLHSLCASNEESHPKRLLDQIENFFFFLLVYKKRIEEENVSQVNFNMIGIFFSTCLLKQYQQPVKVHDVCRCEI